MLKEKLISFVEEDSGFGDITTQALLAEIGKDKKAKAEIVFKESGVVAGVEEACMIFKYYGINWKSLKKDGERVQKGEVVLELEGKAESILLVERTVLNLLGRMSGIATATARVVEKVRKKGSNVLIAATRKTAPGLGYLDKKAVVLGGGDSHRFGLFDAVLLKENHLELSGGVERALKIAKKRTSFTKKIEIEVENEEDALSAAKNGADIIMLDNFEPKKAKKLYKKLKKMRADVVVEISGGINEDNIEKYVECGDVISMGCLTHSVKSLDVSLYLHIFKEKNIKHLS
ncbi:MAG TPA: carboxylating nicotinate-nucleotide diphosphorylase [Thermoplasmata archaeon]|nr:carboxylating nicotinate-nucleotide diphosphorylase [Thermoplasmata archaeon]